MAYPQHWEDSNMPIDPGTALLAASAGQGMFGAASAASSMRFQQKYAKNQMQWRVQDLKRAGLNPILAAGGNGAQIGGGAMAQSPDFAGSVKEAKLIQGQIDNLKADTRRKNAEAQLAEAGGPWAQLKEDFFQGIYDMLNPGDNRTQEEKDRNKKDRKKYGQGREESNKKPNTGSKELDKFLNLIRR
jgi:hypothetical protein